MYIIQVTTNIKSKNIADNKKHCQYNYFKNIENLGFCKMTIFTNKVDDAYKFKTKKEAIKFLSIDKTAKIVEI